MCVAHGVCAQDYDPTSSVERYLGQSWVMDLMSADQTPVSMGLWVV